MKKWSIALVLTVITYSYGTAKNITVTTTDKLYRLLAAAPYALVMFYNRDKTMMQNKNNRQAIVDTEIMLKALRQSPFYQGADLHIILADVSRGDLTQALKDYNVTDLPTFITVVGKQQVGDQLMGFADRAPLMTFINENLKQQMQVRMKEKEAQRERDLEIARIDAYKRNYWLGSPYWDSYWYGGYYPYWFGPYFW